MPQPTSKRSGVEEGGALHIRKVFANALCLELLNVGNSNVQFKDIAEVGAKDLRLRTGRSEVY